MGQSGCQGSRHDDPGRGSRAQYVEAIAQTLRGLLPRHGCRSGTNLIPNKEYVAVLSPDVALHVYEGDWSVLDLEGNVSSEGPIAATTLFVKENGVWKQLHYHQSRDRAVQEESTGG